MVSRVIKDHQETLGYQANLSEELMELKDPWAERDVQAHQDPQGLQGQDHLWWILGLMVRDLGMLLEYLA